MPYLQCVSCGDTLEINTGERNGWNTPNTGGHTKKVIGSIICRSCGAGTGFEIVDNTIIYISGKSSYGSINKTLSQAVKTLYSEAEMCFMNGSPNAAVAMCRSSVEIALTEKGMEGRDLYTKIENSKDILDTVEIGLAHASRLVTRDAIHNAELMSLSDIPSILSATVRILNKLASS
jgi:hypothetical protein